MKSFLKSGLYEYQKQKQAESEFGEHTRRIKQIFNLGLPERSPIALTILTPLISIAWTDGKVGRNEQDAIVRAADEYGIFDNEDVYLTLMERLTSRPHRELIQKLWAELASYCEDLDAANCTAFASHLYQQTRYVGELSEEYTFGFWRTHRAGAGEKDNLADAGRRISILIRNETDERAPDELRRVVPLVEVAWADGRITRRERQMIFDTLVEMNIPESEENLLTLAEWLELRPDDSFFAEALHDIRNDIAAAGPDVGTEQKYDIISRCTLVAEASGGETGFAGGGARICDEEIQTVKQIARILNGAMSGQNKQQGVQKELN